MNVAFTPANFTTVAPARPVPLIVTEVPTGPDEGEKLVIVGRPEDGTTKFVALVPVPSVVVTEIGPVVAPAGTFAFTLVGDLYTKLVPVTPLNFTTADVVKFVPLTVMSVPTGPDVGEKLVIVGAGPDPEVTWNEAAEIGDPPGATTVIGPSVAPAGTVAVI